MEKKSMAKTSKKEKRKLKEKINKKREDLKVFVHNVYTGELTYTKLTGKILNAIKVFIVASRKFMKDDCLTKASSTAYTIIVSLIPTLAVVLTFMSWVYGAEGKKEELFKEISKFMVEHNMKINIDPILSAISGLVDNAASIGGVGAVVMIFSATAMLRSLEKSLNDIFRVKRARTLIMKVIFYWAALTLGPILLIAGTTVATKVTEFFSSPDYRSATFADGKKLWVTGSKSTIHFSEKSDLKFKKLSLESIDFDNQKVYDYDRNTGEFTLKDFRIEPIEFKGFKFSDIQFIGPRGWITGNDGIILTTANRGTSWILRKWDKYDFNDLHMLDTQRGFIAAKDGKILKTEDGGKNWKVLEWEEFTSNFNSISFYKNRGIITGDRGTILITSDRGENWTLRQLDATRKRDQYVKINYAYMINSEQVWLNCSEGLNLYTGNGGKSWKSVNFKSYDYFTSYFFNSKKGFVGGSKGAVIYTEDGGENWKTYSLETYKINRFIYHKKKLWAFGDTGLIQVTPDMGKTWSGIKGRSIAAVLINFFAPFAFIWLLFTFMYMSMPNVKVKFRHASLGGAFTGAVWVIFILLFIYYIKSFAKGTFAVYGSLASIPLFLLMIYSSTVIILYGAEISYTIMHPATYRNIRKTFKEHKDIFVYYGISVLYHVYKKFESGKGATSEKEIIQVCGNDSAEADFFMDFFTRENLIMQSGMAKYVPANTSKNLQLGNLIDLIHQISLNIPATTRSANLRSYVKEIFDKIKDSKKSVVRDITLKDIIDKT
jgi:membrane protein